MEKFDALSKMKKLIEFLNHHTELYNAGTPEIADVTWDAAYFELVNLEREFPSLILPNSPTQIVVYQTLPELRKVKHQYQPMLSLDKTKDLDDIKDFLGDRAWIAMLKLDGLTCRLTYEDGKLVRAETRGDGEEGEDITHNAMVIKSIPKRINYPYTLVIDGEMLCTKEDFKQFSNEYKNSRNFAAGSIRLLDSQECEKRNLTFVAWDIIEDAGEDKLTTLDEKLAWLYNYGFTVVPYFNCSSFEEFDAIVESLKNIAELDSFPIDGLVFKWNNCDEYQAAGKTDHHFRGGLAYKFYDEEVETILRDIEWSMGRTGVLTPVAIYDSVEIEGAECSRASLHNVNILVETLGEYPMEGQKIKVFRASQINPQISWSQKAEEILGADPAYFLNDSELNFLLPPKHCPVCGQETQIIESDSGTRELYCMNDDCSGKFINRLDHWAGKKGLDIKHLSKATLEKLIEWDWVKKITDLYHLDQHRSEWIKKSGFGEKSVDRLLNSIQESRKTDLASFIAAMGIPLIGKTYAKQLAEIFETYPNFRTAITPDPISGIQPFDFTKISGFGFAMYHAIITFNYREFDRLYDMQYIEIKEEATEEDAPDTAKSLEGLTFVITGKLKNYKNRDLLKAEIEARGGKVVGSVSSKTSYLINNDSASTSSKNKTAQQLGVKIITEEELFALWQ